MEENDKYLTPKRVSEVFDIAIGTLANWRCQGRGPEYVKLGRKILYPIDSLDRWSRSCLVRTVESLDPVDQRL